MLQINKSLDFEPFILTHINSWNLIFISTRLELRTLLTYNKTPREFSKKSLVYKLYPGMFNSDRLKSDFVLFFTSVIAIMSITFLELLMIIFNSFLLFIRLSAFVYSMFKTVF